ncbi:MAG: YybH family protein [Acidimicrobiia bacterium]
MEIEAFTRWFDNYGAAWENRDSAALGDLFDPDGLYRANPFDDGVRGSEQIVTEWMEAFEEDSDEAFEFRHELIAVDGDVGVVQGWIEYLGGEKVGKWRNLFVVKLSSEGRCRDYLEWYFQDPDR